MYWIWDKEPVQNWNSSFLVKLKLVHHHLTHGLAVRIWTSGRGHCLQGEQVRPGGPQQVGKHPTDLGHVLNHVKALNPDTKLVFCPRPPPGWTSWTIIGKKSGQKQNSHQCKIMFSCTQSLSLKSASFSWQFNQYFNKQLFSTFRSLNSGIDMEDTALRSNRFFTLYHMPRTSYMWPTIKIRLD